jgi:diadenosine tetraphosphate (Ap4A) HIT family hydrolase
VHFHVIPKPVTDNAADADKQGLVIGWPTQETGKEELAALHAELVKKLEG